MTRVISDGAAALTSTEGRCGTTLRSTHQAKDRGSWSQLIFQRPLARFAVTAFAAGLSRGATEGTAR